MKRQKYSSKSDAHGQVTAPLFVDSHYKLISWLLDTGDYFTFSRKFYALGLSMLQAGVLQDMMNVGSMVHASIKSEGWFVYTVSRMKKNCNLNRDPQQRVINVLLLKKLIKVEKRGNPARRHVWIDLVKIMNDLSRAMMKQIANEK